MEHPGVPKLNTFSFSLEEISKLLDQKLESKLQSAHVCLATEIKQEFRNVLKNLESDFKQITESLTQEILEDENSKFKEKISILKDKLKEATKIIEDLTEQMLIINDECGRLKESLGVTEQVKSELLEEVEYLKEEIFSKKNHKENVLEEMKAKIKHLKNVISTQNKEIEQISEENNKLKNDLIQVPSLAPVLLEEKENNLEKLRIRELGEKLAEASNEIIRSASLIDVLKAENKQLKTIIEETIDVNDDSNVTNECDDGKERNMINKLKMKVKKLTDELHHCEEMLIIRENKISELSSQLNLLKSDEGVNALLTAIKNKKQELKIKDEGIKSLVKDVNKLNKVVNDLQMENESMRRELNITSEDKIPTQGIMHEYYILNQEKMALTKELAKLENQLVETEMDNREKDVKISKYVKLLDNFGFSNLKADKMIGHENGDRNEVERINNTIQSSDYTNQELDVQILLEENEGLRKGLQEILHFLKDNSASSSGVLTLECPSLEAVLNSLEARHAAGWFAPHIATTMQLKAAFGGKDALLTALHQSRKETFELITQLTKESQKCVDLKNKLLELEVKSKESQELAKSNESTKNIEIGEFSFWVPENEDSDIDLFDKTQMEKVILKRNSVYQREVKNALKYFCNKFEMLFDKMTEIATKTEDDKNKWSIQEEYLKAEIENLKALKSIPEDDDASDTSPGLVTTPNISVLERKCFYLEESYKNIRTSYENIKNELLEFKKDGLVSTTKYESLIQNLILLIISLSDKLRSSIPENIFWKQNLMLNEIATKYNQLLNNDITRTVQPFKLYEYLEESKRSVIDTILKQLQKTNKNGIKDQEYNIVAKAEQALAESQLQGICSELERKNVQITQLTKCNMEIQELQVKLIDETLASETKEEINIMKQNLLHLRNENKTLKEQCKQLKNQLDITLLQLQSDNQSYLKYETEINMLRHQVLDLQSIGDNKAVLARLGNEILIAHLNATEYQKMVENLKQSLIREKELRAETEDSIIALQRVFDMYTIKYESKFRYMFEVIQTLRLQYHGCVPLASAENYLNNLQELSKKTVTMNEKSNEIENLRFSLIAKHSVYDQILELTKSESCEDTERCRHKLQLIVSEGICARELEHCNIKLHALEKAHQKLLERCNYLERTLVSVNQDLRNDAINKNVIKNSVYHITTDNNNIVVENVESDYESSSSESGTFTLPKPHTTQLQNQIILQEKKPVANFNNMTDQIQQTDNPKNVSIMTQTNLVFSERSDKHIQTDKDYNNLSELKLRLENLEIRKKEQDQKLIQCISVSEERARNIALLKEEKNALEEKSQSLTQNNFKLKKLNEHSNKTIELLQIELDEVKRDHAEQFNKIKKELNEENQSLLLNMKQIENDKNNIIADYKQLLENERNQSYTTAKELQSKLTTLQADLDGKASATNAANAEIIKKNILKYTIKNAELEDKCFKLQNSLEEYKTEVTSCQSELKRWKELASERLEKMEQMSMQLKERHNQEVESYKAENQHWLVQLNETQREHMELRTQLMEQKALHVKQLSEKDTQIEQLRSVVHNLKTQIMNMQMILSVNDPSFDLSAIVEVEEASDVSQQGSDRLELKFDSTVDLHEMHDDFMRVPATSTTIWQEPAIERLRREKQLLSKQNGILRRQIKAIAARERRARLDAQNLKNQIFRISTSGSKAVTAESAALHNKIASLQSQLTSARRDTHSSVALWDKWKRAQQTSERWQARYEEKCQEITKLEASLNLAKSAVTRLEKEKRVLLSRLDELKNEKQLVIEKQDGEASEKRELSRSECDYSEMKTVPVSTRALLERVEAQQRRIVALEVAGKGNEPLVSEYEKALAENTSLKGQILKLESTLLETQIRSPLKTTPEAKPELEYWRSYCNMLKDENAQLTLRVTSLESTPSTAHQHRVNDLEQTVLTLRGLVSKLQAELKSSATNMQKRVDCRPSSGRSAPEKTRSQLESCKTEISNLKRSIQEKDALLERSKNMLRIAAEREDELLRENAFLRRQLDELTDDKRGVLSA
ncbi:unnamed protein product [Parnassius apollo]|uniref:(apollo) hypothetical protein n=1 Tax=Parnassius apollo TaxID=110799 RepID=A0A8S3X248_PARAO|nr:unnamed protein product [Parnassius apollo]